jgi:hypothetical protein
MPRKPGSKNVKTEQWEIFAEWFMCGGIQRLQQEMDTLTGKEYVYVVKDLLEYFKPKLARQVDQDGNDAPPQSITVTFKNERDNNPNSIQGTVPEIEV